MPDTAPPRDARARILEAAVACFGRSGFHGASMQEICAEARMSPGALYRYFPGKEAIIAAIAEAERERHAAFFESLRRADDPVEALASLGIDMLDAILSERGGALCAETMAEAIRNPAVDAAFGRNFDEARASLADALRRGQGRGLVDPGLDPETAGLLVISLADGLIGHLTRAPALSTDHLRPMLRTLLIRLLRPERAP
jgi:TetR/AcrR family transcriptional regulator, repressor for uid operon